MRSAQFLALLEANKHKKMRFARQASPDNIRQDYYNALRKGPLQTVKSLVDAQIVKELRQLSANASRFAQDGLHVDVSINTLIDRIKKSFASIWTNKKLGELARQAAVMTEKFQRKQINTQMSRLVGVDVTAGAESWLPKAIAEFTAENVSLIKSVPEKYFGEIERIVTKEVADGARAEVIADLLVERFKVAESNAARIARDQVGKYYGDLNRVRQQDLGLTDFVWRTVHDNLVRESHVELDGKTFAWKSPPSEGTPGEPINCRCYAEPVIPSI